MILEDLQQRYGLYLAELIRQALTLEEFDRLEMEELVPYFELRAERCYEEYRSRRHTLPPGEAPIVSQNNYVTILKTRWQQAEEMAHMILAAERNACEQESMITRA